VKRSDTLDGLKRLQNHVHASKTKELLYFKLSRVLVFINFVLTKDDRKANSNSKKLTGKIISFIRKLRNENINENLEVGEGEEADYFEEEDDEEETQNETVTVLNEDEDFDADDIEQVTDYGESDNDQDDAYSIVSTPKPKLQPFFSNANQLNFKDSTVMINKYNSDFNAYGGGLSASLNSININHKNGESGSLDETILKLTQKIEYKLMNVTSNSDLFVFVEESDALMTHFSQELNFESHLLMKNWHELKIFNETIVKLSQTDTFVKFNQSIKLVIIGNDQWLNKYAQSYLELTKENDTLGQLIKHFFVPRKKSILASHIGRLNSAYSSLFCDKFWLQLDDSIAEPGFLFKDIWERLSKYASQNETNVISFQIGECLLNTAMRLEGDVNSSTSSTNTKNTLSIPFLCDVRIKFPHVLDENKASTIHASNSMPQFNMNLMENDHASFYTKNDRCIFDFTFLS
jgi:hypothetical protein